MRLLLACVILFLTASWAHAFDILYDANDPADVGTVALMHGTAEQAMTVSGIQRWKSVHVQAAVTGTVTHFLVRVGGATSNTQPFGFAVYASTGAGASHPPGNTPLIRGYVASYTFSNTGWYAFPFLSDATLSVTSGTWYHLTYLMNVDDIAADPDGARIGTPIPDKWMPWCYGSGAAICEYDKPPGVGDEPTYAASGSWEESASWQCGLLITEAEEEEPPGSLSGCTITGGTIQ